MNRHYISNGKQIVEYCFQLKILVDGEWLAVMRYDKAHGKSYRDILRPKKDKQTKSWLESYTGIVLSRR